LSPALAEEQMSETMKIEFVALAGCRHKRLPGLPQAGRRERWKREDPGHFHGQDFTFSAATLHLIGDQGESLIKKAAAAVKFKGRH